MRVYIDLDSGTVISGPVYAVDVPPDEMDAVLDSDRAARDYALAHGEELIPN